MPVKYLFFFLFSFTFKVSGQVLKDSMLTKNIEIGTFISSNTNLPFWIRSNQYGIVPLKGDFFTLRGDISKGNILLSPKFKKVNLGYGFQGVVNIGKVNQILLPQYYLKVSFKAFELYGGRKKEIVGLVDTLLSSGAYIWSGNALPIPKIQISIPKYTSIIGNGLFSIKGTYAHGWFGKQNYLKDVFLHQKTLYGRLGKPNWKIKMYAGFNHQVQWGGRVNNVNILKTVKNNKIPATFQDYLYLVSGVSVNALNQKNKVNGINYADYDLTNRVGNHIGTIDIAGNIETKNNSFFFYRQSIYDDGSLFFLGNITDGLTGVTIKNKKQTYHKFRIEQLNLELFNSSNQGGNLNYEQSINALRGRDDYFNHGQFLDGWSYNSFALATPFVTPSATVNKALPKYIRDDVAAEPITFFSNNNRVIAQSLGISGSYKAICFNYRLSHSKNLGTYNVPFSTNIQQWSSALSFACPLKNRTLSLSGSIAIDNGKLFNNSQAVMILIRKTWN